MDPGWVIGLRKTCTEGTALTIEASCPPKKQTIQQGNFWKN
jgi:hypothetical protein